MWGPLNVHNPRCDSPSAVQLEKACCLVQCTVYSTVLLYGGGVKCAGLHCFRQRGWAAGCTGRQQQQQRAAESRLGCSMSSIRKSKCLAWRKRRSGLPVMKATHTLHIVIHTWRNEPATMQAAKPSNCNHPHSNNTLLLKGQMHHHDDLGSKCAYTCHLSNKTTRKSVLLSTPQIWLMKVSLGMEADIIRAGHILSTTSDWSRDISGRHILPLISLDHCRVLRINGLIKLFSRFACCLNRTFRLWGMTDKNKNKCVKKCILPV